MTNPDYTAAVADHLRARLRMISTRRDSTLAILRQLDQQERKLLTMFERAFPGVPFAPLAFRWADLTDRDRMTVRFIAHRGHIRRIAEVTPIYSLEVGEDITSTAFHERLSRLKGKGVLLRGFHGWSVAPSVLEEALNASIVALRAPKRERREKAGASRLQRALCAPAVTSWAKAEEEDPVLETAIQRIVEERSDGDAPAEEDESDEEDRAVAECAAGDDLAEDVGGPGVVEAPSGAVDEGLRSFLARLRAQ